ncbi:MAG: class I SAM-dependent methyltransferase [Gemmatimonadaceae bacterium]
MSAGFKDHFSERAPAYASYRPHYPAELAAWLADVAPARDMAWDAACGSGQLSTLLGDRFERVVATDASAAQIGQAVAHAHVEYRVEPAETTSFADRSLDLITVAQAAHWLSLNAFYKEVRRVARPRAVIALIAYGRTHIDPRVDSIVEAFYAGDLDPWWPPERKHIETEYRDLDFPFDRIEAPAFDMQAFWTADQLIGYVRTWSAVRAMESANGPMATERFAESIHNAWGNEARLVRWPVVIKAGQL